MANNKLFALLAAFMMVAVAGVVVVQSSDDSDADPAGTYAQNVNVFYYQNNAWQHSTQGAYNLYEALEGAVTNTKLDLLLPLLTTVGFPDTTPMSSTEFLLDSMIPPVRLPQPLPDTPSSHGTDRPGRMSPTHLSDGSGPSPTTVPPWLFPGCHFLHQPTLRLSCPDRPFPWTPVTFSPCPPTLPSTATPCTSSLSMMRVARSHSATSL